MTVSSIGATASLAHSKEPPPRWLRLPDVDDMHDVLVTSNGQASVLTGADDGPILVNQALGAALEICNIELEPTFRSASAAARRDQGWHRWVVRLAVVCGTAAIVAGIIELAVQSAGLGQLERDRWAVLIEGCLALLAVIAVGLGILAALQRGWLLSRYKAERLRALKFSYLIEPALWSADPALDRTRLQQEVQRIATARDADLDRWIDHLDIPRPPAPPPSGADRNDLADVVAYYRYKRLANQGSYFFRRAADYKRQDRFTRNLPQSAFYGSVLAALVHFALAVATNWYSIPAAESPWVTAGLPALSATLPALGSSIRTIRGSGEFARNRLRYQATYEALVSLDDVLQNPHAAPAQILQDMWYAERILENESREWMRLMRESEWYA